MEKTTKQKVDKLEHVIYGNGVKGISQRVDDIEDTIIEDKQEIIRSINAIEKRQYIFMGGIAVVVWIIEILLNYTNGK